MELVIGGGVVLGGLLGIIVMLLKLRSEGVFVKPSVIRELQDSNKDLSDRLDEESKKRRTLESKAQVDRNRISSLEHNEKMNQKHITEMTNTFDAWSEGIKVLIEQIEGHDSKPNWRPGG